MRVRRFFLPIWCSVFALTLVAAGCGGGDDQDAGATDGGQTPADGGVGLVAGAKDMHCGAKVVMVDQAACKAAPDPDAGAEEEAATMYNDEGDDDDCKYHIKFKVSPVAKDQDVTFTVTLTSKTDGKALPGAATEIEAYLSDTHPAPNADTVTKEPMPGTYEVGPVQFDASGRWTVRFHFFDTCNDTETSPHGHGAFFIDVP